MQIGIAAAAVHAQTVDVCDALVVLCVVVGVTKITEMGLKTTPPLEYHYFHDNRYFVVSFGYIIVQVHGQENKNKNHLSNVCSRRSHCQSVRTLEK